MLFTLTIIVLIAGIVIFFSKEWGSMVKRIAQHPVWGMFLPILVVSWLLLVFEPWIMVFVTGLRYGLHLIVYYLGYAFSLPTPAAHILLLAIVSTVPSIVIDAYRIRVYRKRYEYVYALNTLLFIAGAFLMVHI